MFKRELGKGAGASVMYILVAAYKDSTNPRRRWASEAEQERALVFSPDRSRAGF